MLLAGQHVDRYEVQALLGQGGMAQVFRVRHLQLGTERALKVLLMAHPGVQQRLLQEGRLQASLEHPHIVAVSDVLDLGGTSGLLMEYVPGPALDLWLSRYRPSLDEALAIFRPIVAAVAHAHTHGFIHRDLKPANVLLLRDGDTLRPKVADFGLAKALAEELGATRGTRTGAAMGTPAYMAPEQIRDAKSVDERADVFALGCILYELLCGRLAFGGCDLLSVYAAITAHDYTRAREVVPDLPAHLDDAIDRCLSVDPDERPASCAALLELLGPAPQVAFSSQALEAARKPAEQPLPPLASVQGTFAPSRAWSTFGDAPSMAAASAEPSLAPPTPTQVPPEPSPRRRRVLPLVVLLGVGLGGGGVWYVARSPALEPAPQGAAPASRAAPARAAAPTGGEPILVPVPVATGRPPEEPGTTAATAPVEVVPVVVGSGTAPVEADTVVALMAAEGSAEPSDDTLLPGMGLVRVTGDAEQVELHSSAGVFPPGLVPAGTYRVQARFPGRDPVAAGQVVVPSGKEVSLRCDAGFIKCVQ
ncbi:MAG: serine/threonine-protein kinase [Pseudomonadota bacterium]